MDFPMDFWLFRMCFVNVLYKNFLNFTNVVLLKTTFFCFIGWCLVRQRNPLVRHTMDLKINNLERNTRP
jgi:hypothetical protein